VVDGLMRHSKGRSAICTVSMETEWQDRDNTAYKDLGHGRTVREIANGIMRI
jgi:hypothetical protein